MDTIGRIFDAGTKQVDLDYMILVSDENVQGYVDSKGWSKRKKDLFMAAYSLFITALDNGTLSRGKDRTFNDKSGQLQNNIDGNDSLGSVALYFNELIDGMPQPKEPELDKYTNSIMSTFKKKYYGEDRDLTPEDYAMWYNKDKEGKDGIREVNNRAIEFALVLKDYRDTLKEDYNFEGTAFKDKADLIERLDSAIGVLSNGTFNNDDHLALASLGLNATDINTLFYKGERKDPVVAQPTAPPIDTIQLPGNLPGVLLKDDLPKTNGDRVAIKGGQSLSEALKEVSAEDWVRIGSVGADLVSAVSAFIPGAGTIVSGVAGLTSTLANAGADISDGDFSLSRTGMDLVWDIVGLIPGAGLSGKIAKLGPRAAKILKLVNKVAPYLAAAGVISNAGPGIASFNKICTGKDVTVLDIRNAADLLGSIGAYGRTSKYGGQGRARRKIQALATEQGGLLYVLKSKSLQVPTETKATVDGKETITKGTKNVYGKETKTQTFKTLEELDEARELAKRIRKENTKWYNPNHWISNEFDDVLYVVDPTKLTGAAKEALNSKGTGFKKWSGSNYYYGARTGNVLFKAPSAAAALAAALATEDAVEAVTPLTAELVALAAATTAPQLTITTTVSTRPTGTKPYVAPKVKQIPGMNIGVDNVTPSAYRSSVVDLLGKSNTLVRLRKSLAKKLDAGFLTKYQGVQSSKTNNLPKLDRLNKLSSKTKLTPAEKQELKDLRKELEDDLKPFLDDLLKQPVKSKAAAARIKKLLKWLGITASLLSIPGFREGGEIEFALRGIKFANPDNTWRADVFRYLLDDILNKLAEDPTYFDKINAMQAAHSKIYGLAGNNWQDTAYTPTDSSVSEYLLAYNDLGYNTLAIAPNWNNRYIIDGLRMSGDAPVTWTADNMYSAITDDRRILGRKGDWDESSLEYNDFLNKLGEKGYEMLLDDTAGYYKLAKKGEGTKITPKQDGDNATLADVAKQVSNGFNKLSPELLSIVSLLGNIRNNRKVTDTVINGLAVSHLSPRNEYLPIIGDKILLDDAEAQAALIASKGRTPLTSDMSTQMAYQGDLASKAAAVKQLGNLAYTLSLKQSAEKSRVLDLLVYEYNLGVADENRARENAYKKAVADLRAAELSSRWTNIDTFIKELQYKRQQKNAEDLAYKRKIISTQFLDDYNRFLLTDSKLKSLEKAVEEAAKDTKNPEALTKAQTDLELYRTGKVREMYRDMLSNLRNPGLYIEDEQTTPYQWVYSTPRVTLAKKGTKITNERAKYRNEDNKLFQKGIQENIKNHLHMLDNLSKGTLLAIKKAMNL